MTLYAREVLIVLSRAEKELGEYEIRVRLQERQVEATEDDVVLAIGQLWRGRFLRPGRMRRYPVYGITPAGESYLRHNNLTPAETNPGG